MSGTPAGSDVAARLDVAIAAARLAGRDTLRWFGDARLVVDVKADASPVTDADRAAEAILRRELLGAFPTDAFLGEETGATPGTSGYEWIVDPIDGTKSFIRGVPLYATLVGCRHGGRSGGGDRPPPRGVPARRGSERDDDRASRAARCHAARGPQQQAARADLRPPRKRPSCPGRQLDRRSLARA